MKRFLAGLPGALALAAMVSAALAAVPAPAGPVPDGDVYTIGVTGMTWPTGCTRRVRETLSRLQGVASVAIDFDAGTARVAMKEGATLTRARVAEALKGAGYGVSAFKVEPAKPTRRLYRLGVSGMRWGVTCVARVRATLKGMKGVSDVQVDFRNKVATVQLENGRLSRDAVTAILKEQGYGVTSFKEEALPSGFRPYRVAISGMT